MNEFTQKLISLIKEHAYPHYKKIIAVISALIVIGSGFAIFGSSSKFKNIKLEKYNEPEPMDNTILQVLQASPTDKLEVDKLKKEIFVVFNHPIVPLTMVENSSRGVFSISPSVGGKFRWYGSRICAFIPDNNWSIGTKYTVTVNKGLRSLNKKSLQKSYSFSFSAEAPPLQATIEPQYTEKIPNNKVFVIRFNHSVLLDNLRKHIVVEGDNKNYDFSLSYKKANNIIDKKRILLDPDGKFKLEEKITIVLKPGIKSHGMGALLKEKVSKTYITYGLNKVSLQNKPDFFQEIWNCNFKFENNVDSLTAKKAIRFIPYAKLIDKKSHKTRWINVRAWDLKPNKSYKIKIKNFKDIYGNKLKETREFELNTPHYRPSIIIKSRNRVLESKMKTKIPVFIANMDSVKVMAGNYSLKHIQNDLDDYQYSIVENVADRQDPWKVNLGNDIFATLGYDLSKYLNKNKTGWVAVKLYGDSFDYRGEATTVSGSQVIQVTDLGITVKETYNRAHVWVYSLSTNKPVSNAVVKQYSVSSLKGKAVTNSSGYCEFENKLFNERKYIYLVQKGDSDKAYVNPGSNQIYLHSVVRNHNTNDIKKQVRGQIIFDRKLYRPGDTVHFKAIVSIKNKGKVTSLSKEKVEFKVTDSHGESILNETKKTTNNGGVWTEYEIPADAPLGHYSVKVHYKDSSKDYYLNDTFQVEEFRPSTFSVKVKGPASIDAGKKVNLKIKGSYLFGAPMSGAPCKISVYRKEKRIYLEQYSNYTFGERSLWDYGDYYNINEYEDGGGYFTGTSGKLDNSGTFNYSITAKAMIEKDVINTPKTSIEMGKAYTMKVEATVTDKDDKSVTNTKSIEVFPGKFLIGISTVNRYQDYKKTFDFKILALKNNGLKTTETHRATLYIIKQDWKSILTRAPGDSIQSKNVMVKKIVEEKDITVSSDVLTFSFNPKEAGTYTIIVRSREGYTYSQDSFYASGEDYWSWYNNDDDSVTLVPDKFEYDAGETAKVLIQSPFPSARAIVTLERENIIWQKVISITGKSTPVMVPIKDSYLPNVYLSVMILRPRIMPPKDAEVQVRKNFIKNDLGIPKFKIGIVKLSVNNKSKREKLGIKSNKKYYGPGEKVTLTIKSAPGAEVAVAVADRGVLDLVDYRYADPVNKLFRNWPLSTKVLDNRDSIIKQAQYAQKGENPGGMGKGDIAEGLGGFDKDSDDGVRKDFRHTAYWNPKIITDKKGHATVTFQLPHNLTTFRIMALVTSKGKYNVLNNEFQVKKALVIQKNLPRFIRPGDKLKMGAVVINQTQLGDTFNLSVQSDLLKLTPGNMSIYIGPGQAKEVVVTAELNIDKYTEMKENYKPPKDQEAHDSGIEVSGLLSVQPNNMKNFTRQGFESRDVTDKMKYSFPVVEETPQTSVSVAGYGTDKKAEEFVSLPSEQLIIKNMGGLKITLSSSALVGVENAFSFFKSNPYFCLEQKASAFLASISSGDLLKQFSLSPPMGLGYNFFMIKYLFVKELKKNQNPDGGFRAYPDSKKVSNPYLSAYVTFVLLRARDMDIDFDDDIIDEATDYLENYISDPERKDKNILENLAFIHYVLSLDNKYDNSFSKFLFSKIDMLSMRSKGLLMLAIAEGKGLNDYKKNEITKKIMSNVTNNLKVTTQKVYIKEKNHESIKRIYYSTGSTLGVLLEAFMMLDPNNPLVTNIVQYAIAAENNCWTDSHGAGFLSLALHDFHQIYERQDDQKKYDAIVRLNSKELVKQKFSSDKLQVFPFQFEMSKLFAMVGPGKTSPLDILSTTPNRVYYVATFNYHSLNTLSRAVDNGIEIRREIFDLSGKKTKYGTPVKNNLNRGEIYLCKISVTNPTPAYNIVITDPIPSNVEIVNFSFKTEKSSLQQKTEEKDYNDFWWEEPARSEYRDDRVIITKDYEYAGYHEYFYYIRPVSKGTAYFPQAEAKLMYEPEIYGKTGDSRLTVR